MSTLTPSTTLSDEPICSHTYSMDHLMISQYWGKSADTKYLSGLRKFDHVVIVKAGFESQLRAACVPITFGMRALGMTRQIRDGRLYRGIEPRHVPDLQGLDNPA